MRRKIVKNVLITGRPGIGKTTVIRRLVKCLAGRDLAGFYTEELRIGAERQGFRAVTLAGDACVLAHIKRHGRPRVGCYGVDVETFESLVLPELERPCEIRIIDEIGRMECHSAAFVEALRRHLDEPTTLVATIAQRGGGVIAEVKDRRDMVLYEVTTENRDGLPAAIFDALAAKSAP